MRKWLFILAILCQLCAFGEEFEFKGPDKNKLRYRIISDTKVEIRWCGGRDWKEVIIPKEVTYQGKKYVVSRIGDAAFQNCRKLFSIQIPETVSEIGSQAFEGCTSLRSIQIPHSVTSIGYFAFRGCGLESITSYPPSLTEMGGFFDCYNLSKVIIPNTVQVIEPSAFSGCYNLKSIEIPNSVNKIGLQAFYGSGVTDVKGLRSDIEMESFPFYDTPFMRSDKYKKIVNSFEFHAMGIVVPKLKEWQKKRDFETTAQYQARVTKENQEKKTQELMAEAIQEYTSKNKLKVTVGSYDADYQLYALESNYGKKYVKVPLSEAPDFKNNFSQASFDATYVATTDGLQVNDLTISLNGKQYQAEKSTIEVAATNINVALPEISLPVANAPQQTVVQRPATTTDHSLDTNIPATSANNANTFAIIIGNEKYQQVAQVPFANNDARIFAEYCKKTLGMPEKNVKVYENATYGAMIGAVGDIQKIAKAFKGDINVIFYYAGHGIPDEATGDAYLLPIDADGLNMRVCYPISQLYKELGGLQAKSVTVFMDACFSGAQRGNGMVIAARGVAIKAKNDSPMGKTVVFTAATDKQTAYPFEEKGHGMFTYYLLKKLRDTKGDCTLGELGSYVCDEVAKQAVVTNGKEQTPIILTSSDVAGSWKTMKLK